MQWLCCLPFISKTFWHFLRKSSSQLCQGTFFQFSFVSKYGIVEPHGETNSNVKERMLGGKQWLQAEAGKGARIVTEWQENECVHSPVPWRSCYFDTWLELPPSSGGTRIWVLIILVELHSQVMAKEVPREGQGRTLLTTAWLSPQPRGASCRGSCTELFFLPSACHCGIINIGSGKSCTVVSWVPNKRPWTKIAHVLCGNDTEELKNTPSTGTKCSEYAMIVAFEFFSLPGFSSFKQQSNYPWGHWTARDLHFKMSVTIRISVLFAGCSDRYFCFLFKGWWSVNLVSWKKCRNPKLWAQILISPFHVYVYATMDDLHTSELWASVLRKGNCQG